MTMPEAPKLENVHYDEQALVMDREQIDMLIMSDEGDALLARELFELFATESAAKLDDLPEICGDGDLGRLRDLVHFVAGSAGNLGMARLGLFYRGIEQAIDQNALTDISGIDGVIRQEFEVAREAFRADFDF